jgi:hypothetical protein
MLRYVSEAHYSNITQTTSLQDVIPWDYFNILQYIVDWSSGKCNFYQPFKMPKNFNENRPKLVQSESTINKGPLSIVSVKRDYKNKESPRCNTGKLVQEISSFNNKITNPQLDPSFVWNYYKTSNVKRRRSTL